MAGMIYACYPWELEAAGSAEVLGRLRGEIGIDTINLNAAHPPMRAWLPRGTGDRSTFCTTGGAQFIPRSEQFASGRLRPHPAGWLKGRDVLGRIIDSAQSQGLDVALRAICLIDPGLIERNPHCACVSVFGDAHDARMCPSNPDVRRYLVGLVTNLSSYEPESIELEAVGFGAGFGPEWYANDWLDRQSAESGLLRWCFCASCLQRARDSGIDGGAAWTGALERLSSAANCESESKATLGDVLGADPVLAGYETVRRATVASLIAELAECCRGGLWLSAAGLDPGLAADGTIGKTISGVVIPFISGKVDAACESVAAAFSRDRVRASMRIRPPAVRSGSQLVADVHRIADEGYAAVQFAEDGGSPAHCLDWLRQAVRYARRESGDRE